MTTLLVLGQAVSLWLMWRYRTTAVSYPPTQAHAEEWASLKKGADPSSALSP